VRRLIEKILYGSVETGVNAVETFIRLHLLVFYSRDVGLPTSWVGAALAISILWDAAIDPWMGRVSDHFKNTKGTRIHLMLVGAIATTLSLSALYHPPDFESATSKWFYLLVISLIFNSSQTLFSIPYSAMVGDYASERQERAQFIAWRLVFSNVGAILGIAIPGYYLVNEDPHAYANASLMLAMLVLLVGFLGSLTPPPLKKEKEAEDAKARHPLLQALTNRPFTFLLGGYFVVNIALTINSAMALYFYRLRLQLTEREIQNVLLLFLVVYSISVPIWLFISRWTGRKLALIVGALGIGISNFFIYSWLPVGDAEAAYWFAATISGFFVGSAVILESILTDVVDYDHLKFGHERMGLYFGVWKFSAKFSRALSLLMVGILLDWANVSFPDIDTPARLTLLFGPGVGLFFLLAALFLLPYPLTEKRCAEIKVQLETKAHDSNLSELRT
jgi:GPH family glycoside/pentoside/hexuronide:cation symporter